MASVHAVQEVPLSWILETLGEYARLARKRWYVLALGAAAGAIIAAYVAFATPVVYEAELTFLINEEDGGLPGMGNILGSFGLGGSGKAYDLEKVVALSASNKILNEVLLDSIDIDGKRDLVANHIIARESLDAEWELNTTHRVDASMLSDMSDSSRALLRSILSYTKNSGVLELEADKETGILVIATTFRDEELSFHCANELYSVLSQFYTEQSVSNRRATVEKLRFKADSLRGLLEAAEQTLARRIDTRLGVLGQRERVRETRLEREIPLLGAAYGQVLTNLETSSFALSTSTPFFQPIDRPFRPLPAIKPKPIRASVVGSFLGLLVAYGIVVLWRFVKEAQSPPPSLDQRTISSQT